MLEKLMNEWVSSRLHIQTSFSQGESAELWD